MIAYYIILAVAKYSSLKGRGRFCIFYRHRNILPATSKWLRF